MQWQVNCPDSLVMSASASSARARSGHECRIHTPAGRFTAAVARSGERSRRGRGASSAAPRDRALVPTHSACCATLQALQQGQREVTLNTAEHPEGDKLSRLPQHLAVVNL